MLIRLIVACLSKFKVLLGHGYFSVNDILPLIAIWLTNICDFNDYKNMTFSRF